jgi:hypothetical protein
MTRSHSTVVKTIALGAAISAVCLTLGTIIVLGQQDVPPDVAPLGILPADATHIADPAKRELWEQELSLELTARASSPAPRDPFYAPPPETPIPFRTGFVEGGNPIGSFLPTSQWNGYFAGDAIVIRAGRNSEDDAGMVNVYRPSVGFPDHWISTAPGSGALTIVSVDGDVVSLVDESGRAVTFDIASEVLFSSGTPVAGGTLTPVATVTVVQTPLPQNSPIAP